LPFHGSIATETPKRASAPSRRTGTIKKEECGLITDRQVDRPADAGAVELDQDAADAAVAEQDQDASDIVAEALLSGQIDAAVGEFSLEDDFDDVLRALVLTHI
jgi:hypothetical protein